MMAREGKVLEATEEEKIKRREADTAGWATFSVPQEEHKHETAAATETVLSSWTGQWFLSMGMDEGDIPHLVEEMKRHRCANRLALIALSDQNAEVLATALELGFSKDLFLSHIKQLKPGSPGGQDTIAGGRYTDISKLSKVNSGMSVILRAKKASNGSNFVLKRTTIDRKDAFRCEAAVLRYLYTLGERNNSDLCLAIPFEETFSERDFNYIAMAAGGDNLESLRQPRSPRGGSISSSFARQLFVYAVQTAEIMFGLHDVGLVWGDAKPQNLVWFDTMKKLVAIDFESATVVQGSKAHDALGDNVPTVLSANAAVTIQYAAPEVVNALTKGQSIPASTAQDVWSLGCILYLLATGKTLWSSGETDDDIKKMMLDTSQNLQIDLSAVPVQFRSAIEMSLRRDPRDRATAEDVLRALDPGQSTRSLIIRKLNIMDVKLDEIRALTAVSNAMLDGLAQGAFNCPRLCVLLPTSPDWQVPNLFDPQKWFSNEMKLFFVCEECMRLVPCGPDGKGFSILNPKPFIQKHATVIKFSLMLLSTAAKGAAYAFAGAGASSIIPSVDPAWFVSSYFNQLTPAGGILNLNSADQDGPGVELTSLSSFACLHEGAQKSMVKAMQMQYREMESFMNSSFGADRWLTQIGVLPHTDQRGQCRWVCKDHQTSHSPQPTPKASETPSGKGVAVKDTASNANTDRGAQTRSAATSPRSVPSTSAASSEAAFSFIGSYTTGIRSGDYSDEEESDRDSDDGSDAGDDLGYTSLVHEEESDRGSEDGSDAGDAPALEAQAVAGHSRRDEYTVEFLPSDTKLGMLLEKHDERVVVKMVVDHGPAHRLGVTVGSKVLAVAGRSVDGLTYADTLEAIKSAPRPLRVHLCGGAEEQNVGCCLYKKTVGVPVSFKAWKRRYFVVGGPVAKPHWLQLFASKESFDRCVIAVFQKKRANETFKVYKLTSDYRCSEIKETRYKGAPTLHSFHVKLPEYTFKQLNFASEKMAELELLRGLIAPLCSPM